ncbi:MAG: hypothetical protein KAI83_10895 [Thiomargarita sp.]|nr:hypothetical protein [Thiomargarita sp.]
MIAKRNKKIKIKPGDNKSTNHPGSSSTKGTKKQPTTAHQAEPTQKKKQITAQVEPPNGKLNNRIIPQNRVANPREQSFQRRLRADWISSIFITIQL